MALPELRCGLSAGSVNHQTARHYVVQRLFLFGEPGHEKSDQQDQRRKYLAESIPKRNARDDGISIEGKSGRLRLCTTQSKDGAFDALPTS